MLERNSSLRRPDIRLDRAAVTDDDSGFSRGELLAFARRHAAVIIGCIVMGLALAWLDVASQEPTYTARTQILIDPKTPEVLNTEGRSVETALDTAEVESQMTLLRSELIATMVIDALNLTSDPEFQGHKPSRVEMLVNSVADILLKSGLVDASLVYNWRDRNTRQPQTEPSANQPATPIAGADEAPIDPRRLALAIFQNKLGVSRISVSYVIEIAFSSRDKERAAQIANATADAYLREQVLSKIAAIQQGNTWLEERLNELRRKLNLATQAAQTFRARHDFGIPDAAPPDIATITSPEPSEAELNEKPTLEELEATADTYRKLYGSVLEAFTSSVQYQSFPYSSVRVITPAAEPFEKSRPNTKINLAFGGLLGLLIGLGMALTRESLDGSVRSARQIRTQLGVDCIAEVPRMSGWKRDRHLLANGKLNPGSRFAQSLTRLKTAVRVNTRAGQPVAVGLTSALRGEGKSVTALGLGLACANAGYRTLVVDCDPHLASVSAAYPRPAADDTESGLAGTDGVGPIRQKGWFDLLAPSHIVGFPTTERAGAVDEKWPEPNWNELTQPYDIVIVDLPPIESAIDIIPRAPALDFVVILAEWGVTPVEVVGEAVRISDALGAPLLGVVLTKTLRSGRRRIRSDANRGSGHPIHNPIYTFFTACLRAPRRHSVKMRSVGASSKERMPTVRATTGQVEPSMTDFFPPLTETASQGATRSVENLFELLRKRGADEVALDDINPSGDRPLGGSIKRMADITVASLAITLLAPIAMMVILLLLVTMGRPIFYKHERVGFRRKSFGCLKFRSMVRNPDEALQRYFLKHPEAEQEWIETQKLRDDPRITFVGRMIRKSSLDELPQLVNVLRGEMSCVGPRPIVADELDRYGDMEAMYLSVRPGMTGLWQVSGRSSVDYDRRVALDEKYVRSWSLWLDLKILFKTIPAVTKFHDAA